MQFLVIRNIPIRRGDGLVYAGPPKEELYIRLPKTYKPRKWPTRTNMPCYMCTIVTKRIPLFVPTMIRADRTICRGNNPSV